LTNVDDYIVQIAETDGSVRDQSSSHEITSWSKVC